MAGHRVELYTSTAAASTKVRKETDALEFWLKANKIEFTPLDCASDVNAKNTLRSALCGKIVLPAILVNGKYRCNYAIANDWNESGAFANNLFERE